MWSGPVPPAAATIRRSMRRWLLALLFVVSGAAALCYEVAWTRHLVLVFGNGSTSWSVTVSPIGK